jgi:hypothetical protein
MLRFEVFRMVMVLDRERLDLKLSKSPTVLLKDLIRLDVASFSRSTLRFTCILIMGRFKSGLPLDGAFRRNHDKGKYRLACSYLNSLVHPIPSSTPSTLA